MISHESQETLLKVVGTKYRMVTLFQKRLRELVRGLPALVETNSTDPWVICQEEIAQGKISLIMGEEAEKLRKELAAKEADELAARKAERAKRAEAIATPPPAESGEPGAAPPAPAPDPAEDGPAPGGDLPTPPAEQPLL